MQVVVNIIDRVGGWRSDLYLRIENPPYLPLVIEALDQSGPLGLPVVSVAHYTTVFGVLKRHPEMRFEVEIPLIGEMTLNPYYWRNDFVAVEQSSRIMDCGEYSVLPALYERHVRFAADWSDVLSGQRLSQSFATRDIRT